jgi:hypothetical protein
LLFEVTAKKKRVLDALRKKIEIRPRKVTESTRAVLRQWVRASCNSAGLLNASWPAREGRKISFSSFAWYD